MGRGRRYLGLDVLRRARLTTVLDTATSPEEVTTTDSVQRLTNQEDHAPDRRTTPVDLTGAVALLMVR